jgi:PAS domain S-box-containing protein
MNEKERSMTKKDGHPVRPGNPPQTPKPAKRPGNAGCKSAEDADALEKSLSLLKATVESTADGILVVDKNGRIESSNQKFLEMWRIPPSLAKSSQDSVLLDFILSQLKEPRKFLDKVNKLYSQPSAESFDVLDFKDGRIFERYSLPQKIKNRIVGRVWSFRDVTEQKRAEKVKAAVYKISEITNNAENLEELFQSIHSIISELMPARNFYIALYDPEAGLLSFPYFKDEYDEAPRRQPLRRGLTDYVLRQGEPLLADPVKFLELERSGEVESVGAPSIDWLGVPLKARDKTIGVMVVQTYTEGVRYKEEDKDMLMFVSTQAAVAIERKRAEETLREAQRFLSNVFTSIQDGISILDTDLNILQVNSTMEKWYAHAVSFKGRKCFEVFHGRKERCVACPMHDTLQLGQSANAVVPKIGPGGAMTGWLDIFTFPLIDTATGKMRGVIEYVRDITARKQAEEDLRASLHEKEILLKEIHHRVKNNMQVISSLLSLQSRHLTDKAAIEMFRESQQRIRSMALVHEKLYQSKDLSRIDFSKYIESLIMFLFHSYRVNSDLVRMKTEVRDILLDINSAIPCGLIINELVMNALKHAFPGGRKGEIIISLQPSGDGRFILSVSDNGVGFPAGLDFHKTETLGMQLVTMLVDQLDGTISLEREPGTRFEVVFRELKYKSRI